MVTRAIERSQKRVEAHHFEIRKHLLEYDDDEEQAANFLLRAAHGDPQGQHEGLCAAGGRRDRRRHRQRLPAGQGRPGSGWLP